MAFLKKKTWLEDMESYFLAVLQVIGLYVYVTLFFLMNVSVLNNHDHFHFLRQFFLFIGLFMFMTLSDDIHFRRICEEIRYSLSS